MDNGWMKMESRLGHEYVNGVKDFLTFAIQYMDIGNEI